jgi:hypothetical protein
MFRKLYAHLEEINQNTQDLNSIRDDQQKWGAEMLRELQRLNASLQDRLAADRLLQDRTAAPSSRAHRTSNIITVCVGLIIIGVMVWYAAGASANSRIVLERSAENFRLSGLATARDEQLSQKMLEMQDQTVRLDSLIAQQAKTISELQKMNRITVRAFFLLQEDLRHQVSDRQSTGRSAAAK